MIGSSWSQSETTLDVFPIDVNTRWVYGFNEHQWGWGPVTSTTDTGLIEYIVIDSVHDHDSIRWTVSCLKVFDHIDHLYPQYGYNQRHSYQGEILEILDGDHRVYSNVFEVVPLGRVDWFTFNRYQVVDSMGVGNYVVSYVDTADNWSLQCNGFFQQDSGIIQSNALWSTPMDTVSYRYYRKGDNVLVGVMAPRTIPSRSILYQNYPNPFNPSTMIRYEIPKTEWDTLKIFDILGNQVSTLVSESLLPGSYEVEFQGDGLSGGVYIYQLQVGREIHSNKLLLLK